MITICKGSYRDAHKLINDDKVFRWAVGFHIKAEHSDLKKMTHSSQNGTDYPESVTDGSRVDNLYINWKRPFHKWTNRPRETESSSHHYFWRVGFSLNAARPLVHQSKMHDEYNDQSVIWRAGFFWPARIYWSHISFSASPFDVYTRDCINKTKPIPLLIHTRGQE